MEEIKKAVDEGDEEEAKRLYRALADAQIAAWDEVEGGAYRSYRTADETDDAWDFCKCIKNGWLSYK